MKVLRVVNLILAIIAIGFPFYHFFIDNLDAHMNYWIFFLAFMFLFRGIENALEREKGKKPFNIYLLVAFLILFVLGVDLLKGLI